VITLIGIIVIVGGSICWIGQCLAVFALPTAIRLGLIESENEVDQSMFLFERYSMGIMDILLTWTLPVSALLMIMENSYWPLFALIGGGVYLYLSGTFMITRIILKRHAKKIGRPSSVKAAYVLGWIWILSSVTMIVLAVIKLGDRMSSLG